MALIINEQQEATQELANDAYQEHLAKKAAKEGKTFVPQKREKIVKAEESKDEPVKEAEEVVVEKPVEKVVEVKTDADQSKEVEEDKPSVDPTEPEEKIEDKKPESKVVEKIVDEQVREYALRENLTIAEAKEEMSKNKALAEKYKNPEDLAKLYRKMQSELDKAKVNVKEQPQVQPTFLQNPKQQISQAVAANAEKLVAEYRNAYPAKSAKMEVEEILESVTEMYVGQYQQWSKEQEINIKNKASNLRQDYLEKLDEEDREFLPDIKAVLNTLPDAQITSPGFKIQDLVYWARGQHMKEAIKKAEDRGYKRAKEEARIVGVTSKTTTTTSKGKTAIASTVELSAGDKARAREMFNNSGMEENEMYQAYIEVNPKFKKK